MPNNVPPKSYYFLFNHANIINRLLSVSCSFLKPFLSSVLLRPNLLLLNMSSSVSASDVLMSSKCRALYEKIYIYI